MCVRAARTPHDFASDTFKASNGRAGGDLCAELGPQRALACARAELWGSLLSTHVCVDPRARGWPQELSRAKVGPRCVQNSRSCTTAHCPGTGIVEKDISRGSDNFQIVWGSRVPDMNKHLYFLCRSRHHHCHLCHNACNDRTTPVCHHRSAPASPSLLGPGK